MEFKPIFSGGRSLIGLRVLGLTSVILWLASMGFAYDIYGSFGLNPADGYDGQLAPLKHRIALSLTVAIVFSGFLAFMLFMGRQVVTRILLSEDKQTLRFETIGWGRTDIPRKHLIEATVQHHEGANSTVTVPRLRIRIQDRKWSLWIQMPGEVLDQAAFRKYVLRK